jgi:preprotein translocase subunit SecA
VSGAAAFVDRLISSDLGNNNVDRAYVALTFRTLPERRRVQRIRGRGGLDRDFLIRRFLDDVDSAYDERETSLTAPVMRELERKVLLSVLDRKWREHLYEMDYLQEGIGLRAMAQRDPLVEYQKEGYDLFMAMMDAIKEETIGYLFNVDVKVEGDDPSAIEAKGATPKLAPQQFQYSSSDENGAETLKTASTSGVTRNAPCPCGSGKKYKRCHGQGA